ncbi:metallophosphoesterase [Chondromyces apiculatus]|uniref:Metallophosphoesterase n=1 Tax=Chondromyces apiculatus DSM 436 TaxID=1192034 RepID=A0A017SVC8_9BACT|nr:metallophosphoesterase [Chondromyces apiculatus]EYF00943.1 metallophosphoesterase [Chondromyces apiculatus DSM 436]
MRRFWIVIHLLTALCQVPFALGLHHVLASLGVPGAPWLAAIAGILAAALLRVPLRRVMADQPSAGVFAPLVRLGEELYFAHWCATLGASVLLLVGLVVLGLAHLTFPERVSLGVGALAAAIYGACLVLALYGVLIGRRWVRIRTIDVSIPGLGAAFDGYRIAQLSDLHVGFMCPRERIDTWVARANALEPDLVALTGDYVTSGTAFHDDIASALSALRARDGVFAVMGNHDYFGDGDPLVARLRAAGIVVLRNEHTQVSRAGDRITLAGVDDVWTRRADVARAVAGRDPSLPLIALAHDPALFPKLAAKGASLVLSGHTHWGQFAAPVGATRHNLARFFYRFHAGVYRDGTATLYVNPGMGTTGPPIRIGAPPEITILRLHAAQASLT